MVNGSYDWSAISAISTAAAVVVALTLACQQWFSAARKARRVRQALYPALIDDLKTARAILQSIVEAAAEAKFVRISNQAQALSVISLSRSVKLRTFERYNDLLPSFGPEVAPVVVRIYGMLLRLEDIADLYRSDSCTIQQAQNAVDRMGTFSDQLSNNIRGLEDILDRAHRRQWVAINRLKEWAAKVVRHRSAPPGTKAGES